MFASFNYDCYSFINAWETSPYSKYRSIPRCLVVLIIQELVHGNSTAVRIPSAVIANSAGRPPLFDPLPPFFTVDLQGLVVRMQNAI
jgi:hypothetical protein